MRALVTGGAGFIGSHLVDHLVADVHGVAVTDDLSTGHRDRILSGVALHVIDVVSAREVTDVVSVYQPDVIYHLAAQISVMTRCDDASRWPRPIIVSLFRPVGEPWMDPGTRRGGCP